MARTRGRVDNNQKEIVNTLRSEGYSVAITSQMGKGYPDINVGHKGITLLVEIKNSRKDRLTEHEKAFHANWEGSIIIAYEAECVRKYFRKTLGQ